MTYPVLTRRRLGLAAAGAALVRQARAATPPLSGTFTCKVVRRGVDIGRATFQFAPNGPDLTVQIGVDLRVRLGFIPVFHYTHANTEHWRGTDLVGFASHTNDNGTPHYAQAHWNGTALDVTGSKTAPYTAPPRAIVSSYWNPRTLSDPLINAQDGRLLNLRMHELGASPALTAAGTSIQATEYQFSGDMKLNVWYDTARTLAALQYFARDGSVISYEKILA